MNNEDIIIKNFNEYIEIPDYSFSKQKYNSAVTLYYKALVELCDLELLRNINKIGANHTERFDLLKITSPELFKISSRLFRFYRDSYNKEITEIIAKSVKMEVENAKRNFFDIKKK